MKIQKSAKLLALVSTVTGVASVALGATLPWDVEVRGEADGEYDAFLKCLSAQDRMADSCTSDGGSITWQDACSDNCSTNTLGRWECTAEGTCQ